MGENRSLQKSIAQAVVFQLPTTQSKLPQTEEFHSTFNSFEINRRTFVFDTAHVSMFCVVVARRNSYAHNTNLTSEQITLKFQIAQMQDRGQQA